jgi:hypothetical protein
MLSKKDAMNCRRATIESEQAGTIRYCCFDFNFESMLAKTSGLSYARSFRGDV